MGYDDDVTDTFMIFEATSCIDGPPSFDTQEGTMLRFAYHREISFGNKFGVTPAVYWGIAGRTLVVVTGFVVPATRWSCGSQEHVLLDDENCHPM